MSLSSPIARGAIQPAALPSARHEVQTHTLVAPLAWALLALLTLATAFIRLWNSAGESMRLDESLSIRWALWPLQPVIQHGIQVQQSLFQVCASGEHPPGYFLMLHFWMQAFGTNLATLRLPSEIAGIIAVPALYLLATTLYDRTVGLLASLIGACSPFWIWHAQEARMYPFLLLFTILSTYGLVQALEGGKRWGWMLLLIASALSIYTQYFAFTVLAAQGVFVLSHWRRYSAAQHRAWIGTMLAVGLLYIPWIMTFLATPRGGSDPDLQAPTLYTPLTMLLQFLFGYLNVPITSQALAAWPLLVLASLALSIYVGSPTRRASLLWLLFLTPIVITFLVSFTVRPFFTERYLVVCTPALYILIAAALARLPRLQRATAATAMVALLLLGWQVGRTSAANPNDENFQQVVAYIEAQAGPNDAVALDAQFNQDAYSYYSKLNLPVYFLPSLPGGATQAPSATALEPYLSSMEAGRTRLWVLYYLEDTVDKANVVRRYLAYHTSGHRVIYGGPYERDQPRYPNSYTRVQLVEYFLIPHAVRPLQVRPPTMQQVRALTPLSPTLREPFLPPFGAPGGGGWMLGPQVSMPHPAEAWHFPALMADGPVRLSLYNPNQYSVNASVSFLSGGRVSKRSVHLPAASNLEIDLGTWGSGVTGAPLTITAPAPVIPQRLAERTAVFSYGQLGNRSLLPAPPHLSVKLQNQAIVAGRSTQLMIQAPPLTLVQVRVDLSGMQSRAFFDLTDSRGRLALGLPIPANGAVGRTTQGHVQVQIVGAAGSVQIVLPFTVKPDTLRGSSARLPLVIKTTAAKVGGGALLAITSAPETLVHVSVTFPGAITETFYDTTDNLGHLFLTVHLPANLAKAHGNALVAVVIQAQNAQGSAQAHTTLNILRGVVAPSIRTLK